MQTKFHKKQRLDDKSWERFNIMYQNGVAKQKKRSLPREDNANSYTPEINERSRSIKRDKSIGDLLYCDAKRRQELLHKRIHSSIDHHQQSFVSSNYQNKSKGANRKFETRLSKKLMQLNNGNLDYF
jgi:hypothetical protein